MAGGYLSSLIDYYDDYSTEVLRRWNDAIRDIGEGDYEPKQLVSDVVFCWSYGVMGLVPGFLATKPLATPTVVLKLRAGEDTAVGNKRVHAPGEDDPTVQDLKEAGGKVLPAANVKLSLIEGRKKLKVEISGLKALAPDFKLDQIYRGDVELNGKTIARIAALVAPGKKGP